MDLWGVTKDTVYGQKPRNLQHLKQDFTNAFIYIPLHTVNSVNVVWQSVVVQCVLCIAILAIILKIYKGIQQQNHIIFLII